MVMGGAVNSDEHTGCDSGVRWLFSAGVVPALTMAAALMLTDWPLAVQRGHSSDARPGLPYSMEGQ